MYCDYLYSHSFVFDCSVRSLNGIIKLKVDNLRSKELKVIVIHTWVTLEMLSFPLHTFLDVNMFVDALTSIASFYFLEEEGFILR